MVVLVFTNNGRLRMCTFDTGMPLMISRSAHRSGVTIRKHHKDGILFYFLENRVVFLILTGRWIKAYKNMTRVYVCGRTHTKYNPAVVD